MYYVLPANKCAVTVILDYIKSTGSFVKEYNMRATREMLMNLL